MWLNTYIILPNVPEHLVGNTYIQTNMFNMICENLRKNYIEYTSEDTREVSNLIE